MKDGRPVKPMRIESPTWLAISHAVHPEHGERYILYFLYSDGRPIDFAPRRSLDAAMDEVAWVVQRQAWRECSLVLEEDWERIPRESIA